MSSISNLQFGGTLDSQHWVGLRPLTRRRGKRAGRTGDLPLWLDWCYIDSYNLEFLGSGRAGCKAKGIAKTYLSRRVLFCHVDRPNACTCTQVKYPLRIRRDGSEEELFLEEHNVFRVRHVDSI